MRSLCRHSSPRACSYRPKRLSPPSLCDATCPRHGCCGPRHRSPSARWLPRACCGPSAKCSPLRQSSRSRWAASAPRSAAPAPPASRPAWQRRRSPGAGAGASWRPAPSARRPPPSRGCQPRALSGGPSARPARGARAAEERQARLAPHKSCRRRAARESLVKPAEPTENQRQRGLTWPPQPKEAWLRGVGLRRRWQLRPLRRRACLLGEPRALHGCGGRQHLQPQPQRSSLVELPRRRRCSHAKGGQASLPCGRYRHRSLQHQTPRRRCCCSRPRARARPRPSAAMPRSLAKRPTPGASSLHRQSPGLAPRPGPGSASPHPRSGCPCSTLRTRPPLPPFRRQCQTRAGRAACAPLQQRPR
mmetsp:Transcript_21825/g.83059  ORF Transcript_21825/g.83059 Transcript_21825/m.83059 type:complete len:361 (-) Transcript_21825:687-1769(-)